MRIYFNIAAMCWTTVIAYFMHSVIVLRNVDVATQWRRRPVHHLYAWGLPVFFTMLPLLTDNYGNNGAWCSITSQVGSYWWGVVWHFVCLYIPCWVAIAYNLSTYLTVHRVVKGLHLSLANSMVEVEDKVARDNLLRQQHAQLQFIERLQLYPLVLIVCWTWATVYRIHATLEPSDHVYWLASLAYTFTSLMGFLNACCYVGTPAVWRAWRGDSSMESALLCGMGECGRMEFSFLRSHDYQPIQQDEESFVER